MRNYCFIFLALLSTILPFQVLAVSVEPSGYRATVEPNSTEEFLFTIANTALEARTYELRFAD